MNAVTPLVVNDKRALGRDLIKTIQDVYGITEDWVEVKDTTYWVRREPGQLLYVCYGSGWGPAGYVAIGRRPDGRIVMQAQTSRCEPLGGEKITEFGKAMRLVHGNLLRHAETVNA